MKDQSKTKQMLIEELASLRGRNSELEQLDLLGRQSRECLLASEEQYRTLVDNVDFGINLIDKDFKIITTNIVSGKQFNKPVAQLIGKYCFEEFEKRLAVCPHCPAVKAMSTGQPQQVDTEGVRDDGGRFSARIHVFPLFYPDGSLRGFNEVVIDITDLQKAEEALRESELLQSVLLANLPAGVIIIDPVTRIIENVNNTAAVMFGVQAERIVGHRCHAYLCPAIEGACPVCDLGKEVDNAEREMVCADGSRRPVLKSVKRVQIRGQEKLLECFVDITAQKRAEKALQKSEEEYRTLVDNASDIIFRADGAGRFTFVNPAALRITGYEEKELIGKHYPTMICPDMRDEIIKFFSRQYVKGIQNTYLEYPILTKEGHEVWLGQNTQLITVDGHVVGFQAVARDIRERKRMEAEILALSITDQLTGLHNRRGFLSLAEQQLKLAQRNKSGVLLFFADLDGLKWINDTLGHEEGDKSLIEAATVLKETFRTSDIIARLGGDEYAVLAVDITEENSGIFTARLQNLIDMQNTQENQRYRLSISVGCSFYDPEKPCSIDELMASADKLMYEQKQNKKRLLLQGASLSTGNLR